MSAQNYSNHAQWVPAYHRFLFPLTVVTFIASLVNLFQSFDDHSRLYNAALISSLSLCMALATFYARIFALKAQDRAIRAEENLRHFVLTGRLLDSKLSIKQIVALRFAPDAEFTTLASRAAAESLTPDAIKRTIQNWKADFDRA